MSSARPHRGGTPVGYLEELEPLEERAVLCLRHWHAGGTAQRDMCTHFGTMLGSAQAVLAIEALAQICDLCTRHARRPLLRHQVSCKCIGADEACFANFIAAAAEGEREDAMLIATLFIRHDFAPCLVGLAENLGLALKRLTQQGTAPLRAIHPQTNTFH